MPKFDLDGLQAAGASASARLAGLSYYGNPIFTASVPLQTAEQWIEWHDLSCTWAAAGFVRTPAVIRPSRESSEPTLCRAPMRRRRGSVTMDGTLLLG